MNTVRIEPRDLILSGQQLLRKGDAARARECFQAVVSSGHADAATLLGLARACRALGDQEGGLGAANGLLAAEPQNFQALIVKADLLADAGNARGASAFYAMAVKTAPPDNHMPAELRGEVARARAMCDRYAREFEGHMMSRLADGQASARFARSMDLVLGKRQIYLQQPRYYYFPELPQVQFYDRAQFAWLAKVEAATAEIRAELLEVMREPGAFKPYVEVDPSRPQGTDQGMLNNPAWSAFYLVKNGVRVEENALRCPRTLEALAEAPMSHVADRSPSVLFSLLQPGAHIPAHNGFVNTRLICHLPIIVPRGCAFRVGNETREWVEGEALVFDDSIEHEAWNRSRETRVVLLFDVWRPELSEVERGLVRRMFAAIDEYSGQPVPWGT